MTINIMEAQLVELAKAVYKDCKRKESRRASGFLVDKIERKLLPILKTVGNSEDCRRDRFEDEDHEFVLEHHKFDVPMRDEGGVISENAKSGVQG